MPEINKSFISINLKITTVVIFCVSVGLSMPTIVDATGNFGSLVARGFSVTDNSNLNSSAQESGESEDTYIPPNYGGPDSQHGSGTR